MFDIKPIGKLTSLNVPENEPFAKLRGYAFKTV